MVLNAVEFTIWLDLAQIWCLDPVLRIVGQLHEHKNRFYLGKYPPKNFKNFHTRSFFLTISSFSSFTVLQTYHINDYLYNNFNILSPPEIYCET